MRGFRKILVPALAAALALPAGVPTVAEPAAPAVLQSRFAALLRSRSTQASASRPEVGAKPPSGMQTPSSRTSASLPPAAPPVVAGKPMEVPLGSALGPTAGPAAPGSADPGPPNLDLQISGPTTGGSSVSMGAMGMMDSGMMKMMSGMMGMMPGQGNQMNGMGGK